MARTLAQIREEMRKKGQAAGKLKQKSRITTTKPNKPAKPTKRKSPPKSKVVSSKAQRPKVYRKQRNPPRYPPEPRKRKPRSCKKVYPTQEEEYEHYLDRADVCVGTIITDLVDGVLNIIFPPHIETPEECVDNILSDLVEKVMDVVQERDHKLFIPNIIHDMVEDVMTSVKERNVDDAMTLEVSQDELQLGVLQLDDHAANTSVENVQFINEDDQSESDKNNNDDTDTKNKGKSRRGRSKNKPRKNLPREQWNPYIPPHMKEVSPSDLLAEFTDALQSIEHANRMNEKASGSEFNTEDVSLLNPEEEEHAMDIIDETTGTNEGIENIKESEDIDFENNTDERIVEGQATDDENMSGEDLYDEEDDSYSKKQKRTSFTQLMVDKINTSDSNSNYKIVGSGSTIPIIGFRPLNVSEGDETVEPEFRDTDTDVYEHEEEEIGANDNNQAEMKNEDTQEVLDDEFAVNENIDTQDQDQDILQVQPELLTVNDNNGDPAINDQTQEISTNTKDTTGETSHHESSANILPKGADVLEPIVGNSKNTATNKNAPKMKLRERKNLKGNVTDNIVQDRTGAPTKHIEPQINLRSRQPAQDKVSMSATTAGTSKESDNLPKTRGRPKKAINHEEDDSEGTPQKKKKTDNLQKKRGRQKKAINPEEDDSEGTPQKKKKTDNTKKPVNSKNVTGKSGKPSSKGKANTKKQGVSGLKSNGGHRKSTSSSKYYYTQDGARRRRPGVAALKQIAKYQSEYELLISKRGFKRFVQSILADFNILGDQIRMGKDTSECLQEASEAFLVDLLRSAQSSAIFRGALGIKPKDLEHVIDLRGPVMKADYAKVFDPKKKPDMFCKEVVTVASADSEIKFRQRKSVDIYKQNQHILREDIDIGNI